MFRFLLLACVAVLVVAAPQEDGEDSAPVEEAETTPDTTSDEPESTADINTLVDNVGPGVQFDTTTDSDSAENATTTEEAVTDSGRNLTTTTTTESPSSAATLGVSVTGLALLAVAVMS